MTAETTTPRELLAEVAQTAHLSERQDNASAHAATLVGLFDAPVLKQVPKREWRSHYWIAGEMHAVLITQVLDAAPTPQGPTPKLQVQLTCNHHAYPQNVKFLSLFGDYDVLDVVAFLGLDALAPDAVSWRDVTRYRTLLTVEALVARATTRLPN